MPSVGTVPTPEITGVDRARVGDEAAFAMLVRSWTPVLLRTATVVSGGAGDEADVVRRTWLRVVRDLPFFPPHEDFRAWVCRRLVAEAGRDAVPRPRSPAGASLASAAAALPPSQRLVLGLRDAAGCELAEVARTAGLSPRETLRLLTRAREGVRRQLPRDVPAAVTPTGVR